MRESNHRFKGVTPIKIQAEKKGKWVKFKDPRYKCTDTMWKCTSCNAVWDYGDIWQTEYCPFCGSHNEDVEE